MGVVWEAHSLALDIPVAIKLIHPSATNDEDQERLLREAKAVARLADPGVVRVFDCGKTSSGEPYVVMELLAGQDLANRLNERGCLLPVEAVRTLLPVVRALGSAHLAHIVHRDIKPENVFLARTPTGDEQPKLLDFGIAKVEFLFEKRITHLGSTMGSPNYMSPEQARGEDVDLRADLWGICVVLYEAITARVPFYGDSYNAVMYAILSAPLVPFMDLAIDEPELWAIVARGLERNREARWQTSEELLVALSSWLINRGVDTDLTGVALHVVPRQRLQALTRRAITPAGVDQSKNVNALLGSAGALSQTIGRDEKPRSLRFGRSVLGSAGVVAILILAAVGAFVYRGKQKSTAFHTTPAVSLLATTTALPAIPSVLSSNDGMSASPVVPSPSVPPMDLPNSAERKHSGKRAPTANKTAEPFKNPFE
jgi:serine/threonine-protein kinase